MRAQVKKWGNSAAVRLPAALLAAAHLKEDDAVELREEGGRIVIEPLRPKAYALAELLAGIQPEHLHEAADFGPAQGAEVW